LPLNISGEQVQERLNIARRHALISLLHYPRVFSFVHEFSPSRLRDGWSRKDQFVDNKSSDHASRAGHGYPFVINGLETSPGTEDGFTPATKGDNRGSS
jgi:hypothetical protein